MGTEPDWTGEYQETGDTVGFTIWDPHGEILSQATIQKDHSPGREVLESSMNEQLDAYRNGEVYANVEREEVV